MVYLRKLHGQLLTYAKTRSDLAITTLEEIELRGFPKERNIVISCLAPSTPHNFIFGDLIPFDEPNTGPYKTKTIEKIKEFLTNSEKFFIFIFPQRYPLAPIWKNNKDFNYIELPEFYGVYWDFFKHHQPLDNYRPFDRYNVTKHYMCLNKRITEPRFLWFHELYKNKLIDKGHVSFLCEGEREKYPDYNVYKKHLGILTHGFPWLKDYSEEVIQQLPIQTDQRLDIEDRHCGSGGWITDSEMFATSFVNVISETYFSTPGNPMFTEKIFKTIYHQRPFILLGNPGTLNDLRMLGFRTFNKWFDESYDYGNNINRRALDVCDQIKHLCSLSLDQIQDMLMDMKSDLEYNYNRLHALSFELDRSVARIDQWIIKKIDSFKD